MPYPHSGPSQHWEPWRSCCPTLLEGWLLCVTVFRELIGTAGLPAAGLSQPKRQLRLLWVSSELPVQRFDTVILAGPSTKHLSVSCVFEIGFLYVALAVLAL